MLTNEQLQLAINSGMIDLPSIEEQIAMNIKKQYLERHTHAIWQSTDGKWCTYLPSETKEHHRALCKRKTREEVESAIVAYWKDQDENPPVNEVFNEWNNLKLQRHQIKESTHSRNREYYKRFFSEFGKKKIKNI